MLPIVMVIGQLLVCRRTHARHGERNEKGFEFCTASRTNQRTEEARRAYTPARKCHTTVP